MITAAEEYAAIVAERDLMEAERDEAIRERDEAQAVIDAVREVRKDVATKKRLHYDRWNETDDGRYGAKVNAYDEVLAQLNKVDGL